MKPTIHYFESVYHATLGSMSKMSGKQLIASFYLLDEEYEHLNKKISTS